MWGAIVTPKLEYIMQGWINVADRGIIGNGSSDVSTALNNLITEVANQGGGVLYFPPGTYILSNQVTLQNNVSLIGAERDRCILKNTSLGGRINAHVNNVKIANLTFNGVQIYGAIATQAKGGNVTIENCRFTDCNYTHIDMYVSTGGSGGNPGFVIRNCFFSKGSSSSNLSKINIQAEQVPVLIENCSIDGGKYNVGSYNEITISGYQATIRNLRWTPSYGNSTLISTSCDVFADNIWYNANYDTKTIFNIASSSVYVIVSGVKGSIFNGTLNLVTGYSDNLIKLDEYAWRGRNPAGASLWLPTERFTTSTSYVTIKRFRTTISGEIRVKAEYGISTEGTGDVAYIRVLKNGNLVYETNASFRGAVTADIDIPCSRGDLIEFQGRTTNSSNAMYLRQVWVYYIPIRAGDFYGVID
jgi:hypothetical protein